MTTLQGTPLDRNAALDIDDLIDTPWFDDLFKETIRHGSSMIPELWAHIEEADRRLHTELVGATQTFSIIDMEFGEVCKHNVPVSATCTWCLDGLPGTNEYLQGTIVIGKPPSTVKVRWWHQYIPWRKKHEVRKQQSRRSH